MDMTSSEKSSKRKPACLNCRRSHTKCDDQRPCSRCSSLGLTGTCVEVPRRAQIKWHSQPYPPSGSISGEQETTTVFTESGVTESLWRSPYPQAQFTLIKCDGKFLQLVNYSAEEILFILTLEDLFGSRNNFHRNLLTTNGQIGPLECRIKTGLIQFKNVMCTASVIDGGEYEHLGEQFSSDTVLLRLVMQDREEIANSPHENDMSSDLSRQPNHFISPSSTPHNLGLRRDSVFKSKNLVPARRTVSLGSYEPSGPRESPQSDWKWIDSNNNQHSQRQPVRSSVLFYQLSSKRSTLSRSLGTSSTDSNRTSLSDQSNNLSSLPLSLESFSNSIPTSIPLSTSAPSVRNLGSLDLRMKPSTPFLPLSYSTGQISPASPHSSSPLSPLSPIQRDYRSPMQTNPPSSSSSPPLSPSPSTTSASDLQTIIRFDDLRLFSPTPTPALHPQLQYLHQQNQQFQSYADKSQPNQFSPFSFNQNQTSLRTLLLDVEIPPRESYHSQPSGIHITSTSTVTFLPSLIKSPPEKIVKEETSANRVSRKEGTAKGSIQMILN